MAELNITASSPDYGFASLQWARAIAATAVVIYHCGQAIEVRTSLPVTRFTNFGSAGVDIFFVISGLIMTLTTRRHLDFSATDFLMRRIIRIVPIYWIYTLLKSAVLLADPKASLFSHFSLGQLVASLFFIPFSEERGIYPILVVGWTLNYEAFFYLVFATSKVIVPSRWQLLLVGVLFGFALGHFVLGNPSTIITFWTEPIILEFAVGVGAAELYLAGWRPSGLVSASMMSFGGCALLIIPEFPLWRPVFWGIPAFLIVFGMLSTEGRLPYQKLRGMIAIGDSSYSLYITHTLVIPVLATLIFQEFRHHHVGIGWAMVPMAVGSVFVGWICYLVVERPLTRGLQNAWRRRRIYRGVLAMKASNVP